MDKKDRLYERCFLYQSQAGHVLLGRDSGQMTPLTLKQILDLEIDVTKLPDFNHHTFDHAYFSLGDKVIGESVVEVRLKFQVGQGDKWGLTYGETYWAVRFVFEVPAGQGGYTYNCYSLYCADGVKRFMGDKVVEVVQDA